MQTIHDNTGQALKVFRDYCAKMRMRYTPERELIIKEIYREDGHFNVDALYARIRTRHPRRCIAKTSIYRSVPYFLDAGILRASIADAGHVVYERLLGRGDHDHFKCIKCGKIAEFFSPELSSVQKKLCRDEGFKILWRMNVVNGICEKCQGHGTTEVPNSKHQIPNKFQSSNSNS